MSAQELSPSLRDCTNCPRKVIDEVYSDILKTNFMVVDLKKDDGVIERHIQRTEGSESAKILIAPEGEEFEKADTREWKVDNKALRFHTMAAMISSPFMVSALSLDNSGEGESLLEIGLGGATTHMFLTDYKPQLNILSVEYDEAIIAIATKWFGVSTGGPASFVHDDGLKVIERTKAEGKKYDVVIVDASDGDKYKPAPPMAFLQDQVIQGIKSILKPNGAVMMNIAYVDPAARLQPSEKDTSVFKKHFPYCLKLKMTSPLENNEIQICTTKPLESEEFYKNRLAAVRSALGFDKHILTLADVDIVREW